MPVNDADGVRSRRAVLLLTAILLVLLAARVYYVVHFPFFPIERDAAGYDAAAVTLLESGTFSYPISEFEPDGTISAHGLALLARRGPNALVVPGYPILLAGIYAVAGTGPGRLVAVRVVQAVLSVLAAFLTYLTASRLWGRRIGLVALCGMALVPQFTFATELILTESVFLFLLVLFGYLVVVALDTRRLAYFAAAGLVYGAGTLVRPTFALWPLLLFAGLLLRDRRVSREVVRSIVVFSLAALLLFVPWWVRNYRVYGVFVPMSTASAGALLGSLSDSYLANSFPSTPYPSHLLGDDLALGAWWRREASARLAVVLRDRPGELVSSRLVGLGRALTWDWPDGIRLVRFYPSITWIDRAALWVLDLLAAVGLVAGRRKRGVLLVASIPLYFIAVHLATLVLNRYLFPQLPFQVMLSAVAIVALYDRVRSGRSIPFVQEA